jgi:GMP synthase (glutamine-hydrolysing)
MRSLLMLRNEAADDFGLAPAAFAAEGLPLLEVDAWDESTPWPGLDELSGVAVFGGAMNCDQVDRFPFLARERVLLAKAVAEDVPVLGVCLGAQLLVRAFDQPVFEAPAKELGFPPIRVTAAAFEDPVLGALPSEVRCFQWHEDAFREPPGATVLATGRGDSIQAFRHGSAWGVQFHPEVTAAELDRWFDADAATLGTAWGRDEAELRAETARWLPAANRCGTELLRGFARFVRERSAS